MTTRYSRRAALVGVLGLPMIAATKLPAPVVVTGAGSTFVNPILSKWTADYMADFHASGGTRISYQAIGSGAGIDLIKAHKVDFGASDKPLPPEELAKAGLGQFPLVIGGVVPVMNLPGIAPGKVRFSGQLLAEIYLGKVKKWNDPEVAKLNPGVSLPASEIAVVHRSDGSGTTFNWVNFLSKTSPEWKAKVGDGTTVNWPIGVGAAGNDGVATVVRKTPYSLGYVELAYVGRDNLTWGMVRNRGGQFIVPDQVSFQAAAEGADWNAARDFHLILTDAPGHDAYPITATTFVLMPKHLPDYTKNRALIHLFEWALFKGQAQAEALGYVPLPRGLAIRVATYWNTELQH